MSHQATAWVMEFSESRLSDRLVLLAIAHRVSNDNGEAFPSIATIAREANVSESSVHASLRKLSAPEMRELEIDERPSDYGTNIYRMPKFLAWLASIQAEGRGAKSAPQRRKVCTRGVQSTGQKALYSAPEPSVTITEPSKERHTVCDCALQIWNDNRGKLQQVAHLTKDRRRHIADRINADSDFLEKLKLATQRAARTPFLLGDAGGRGWRASFDWLIENDTNCVAVLEGKYDAKNGGANGASRRPAGGHFSQVDQNWDQPITVLENKRRVQ